MRDLVKLLKFIKIIIIVKLIKLFEIIIKNPSQIKYFTIFSFIFFKVGAKQAEPVFEKKTFKYLVNNHFSRQSIRWEIKENF